MIELLSLLFVVLTGLYFIALAGISLFNSDQASRYLLGFAGSRPKHFAELFVRFLVGGAFVLYAPRMFLSDPFSWFGWILIATTIPMTLLPWKLHRKFAQYSVPKALQYVKLIGVISLLLGGFVLFAVLRGSTA